MATFAQTSFEKFGEPGVPRSEDDDFQWAKFGLSAELTNAETPVCGNCSCPWAEGPPLAWKVIGEESESFLFKAMALAVQGYQVCQHFSEPQFGTTEEMPISVRNSISIVRTLKI